MLKNCLAIVGLITLLLLLFAAFLVIAPFIDINSLPDLSQVAGTPIFSTGPNGAGGAPAPSIAPGGTPLPEGGILDRFNPLGEQPTPTPAPTATLAPMAPDAYRVEVMLQLQNFADALERWLDANEALSDNQAALDDPAWQQQVRTALDDVQAYGRALSEIGPPPPEYEAIDAWLKRIGPEAEALRSNYLQAMESGNPQDFTAASDSFERIKEYLTQAAEQMIAADWPLE